MAHTGHRGWDERCSETYFLFLTTSGLEIEAVLVSWKKQPWNLTEPNSWIQSQSCVTLGKLLYFSEFPFPPMQDRDGESHLAA